MRIALGTSVLALILMVGIVARSNQASAQSLVHADFQGYWMGVDPVDGGDARRSLILRFELVERGLRIETATLPDGNPVSTIVLHRVSTNETPSPESRPRH